MLSESLRSLVLLGLLFLFSSSTDFLLSLLKPSELLRFLLHLVASELWNFARLLMSLVLISWLLIGLLSWADEFGHVDNFGHLDYFRHIHTICVPGTGISFPSNGRESVTLEEGNLVSSGNYEGRLDDDSRSNDVRLNFLPDGGIEEPERRAGETPGPSTVISHGTDGLESSVQSVMVPFLRRVVDNLGDWERMFEKFNLENVLRNTPSYSDRLNQITNNVHSDFPRLLQLLERNPSLSPENLKVYCVPLCWNSKERVGFLSDLSDELLSRADELKKLMLELGRTSQLHFGEKRNDKLDDELLSRADELKKFMLELERTWQLHFGEKRNDKIDEEWINEFGDKWRPYFGEKWIDIIDKEWIENFGKKWIDEKIEIEEWIENVDPKYRPRGSDFIFVRGLLRFMRNRRHHSDKFQESHGLRSVESFYNYLDALFPYLLMVSYGFSYRFCREEAWFKKYR